MTKTYCHISGGVEEVGQEKGKHLKFVCSFDEAGLFWNQMLNTIYSNGTKEVPGQKNMRGGITLPLCGRAARHMVKPGVECSKKNLYSHKTKNEVSTQFWQYELTIRLTSVLLAKLFYHCFILEVKPILKMKS